jgi:lysophospholipase L1-like esterase
MPFINNALATLGQQAKRGVSPSLFSYRSADTKQIVLADGYFDNGVINNTGARAILSVGDMIMCDLADGYMNLRVATNSGGVVTAAEVVPSAGRGGIRTVLFGDSMVDTYETFAHAAVSNIAYDRVTGVLTVTSNSHGLWTGARVRFWNFNYASTRDFRILPITRTGVNTYTMTLTDRPQDVPNGNLGTTFFSQPIDTGLSFAHWIGILQQRLGFPLEIVLNAAQNGENSRDGLARVDSDLRPYQPQLVIYQLLGLNDLSTNQNFPTQDIIRNNRAIIDKICDMGARLLLLTTTPVVTGETRGNISSMQRIIDINKDAMIYARSKPNVQVVDAYSRIVDPASASGFAVAARLRSADLIHYNYTGANLIAPDAIAAIEGWFPVTPRRLTNSVIDCHLGNRLTVSSMVRGADGITVTVVTTGSHLWLLGESFTALSISAAENGFFSVSRVVNATTFEYLSPGTVGAISAGSATLTRSNGCFNNPLFLTATGGTTTNGVTGTAAARLTCTNAQGNTGTLTCAASVAAAVNGVGNEQLLTITAAAANDKPRIAEVGTTAFLADLLPGRKYRLSCRFRMTSTSWAATPLNQFLGSMSVTWSTGEVYTVSMAGGWDGVEPVTLSQDQTLFLESGLLETVIPQAGATIGGASFLIQVNIGGTIAAQTLVLGLSQLTIRDVTDNGY